MRFADPTSCPECRGRIAGNPACPHCGFDLLSTEARELWQTLLRADALLARAAQKPRAAAPQAASSPAEPFVAVPQATAPLPTQRPSPAPAPAQATPRRPWPVGTILLVLGALGLIVAGLIFVTRSWDSIGLAGKAAILLGVTAAMGALGVWVTRRGLRASAEAVWSVFLALLTLDVFAARHEGLAGLDAFDVEWMCVVWGTVAVAVSVAIGLTARARITAELIAPAVAAALAITLAGLGAGAIGQDLAFGWRAFIALIVAGLLALATRPAQLRHLTVSVRIVVAGFFFAAYLSALVQLLDHPALDDLVGGGHGLPMLVMGIAALVVGWVVPVVRIPAVALGIVAVCALVVTPVAEAGGRDAAWAAVATLAALLAAVGIRAESDWMRGVRLGAVPAVAGLAGLHAGLFAEVLGTIGRILADPWQLDSTTRLDVTSVDNHPAWAVLIAVAALIVVATAVPWWPEMTFARPEIPLVAGVAVGLGVVNAVVGWRLPLWVMVAVLLGTTATMVVLHLRGLVASVISVSGALVLAASFLAAGSQGVSAWAWIVGAALLAALALAGGAHELRQTCAGLAAALLLGGAAALADLVAAERFVTSLVVIVLALALVAVSGLWLPAHSTRLPVEVVAGIGLACALLAGGTSAEVAVRWTVAGVVLIALGFMIDARRWYVWPGVASLIVAYVALIVDSGFSFVEAYTLPLGVAALAAGLTLLRGKPDASTWTYLAPGLAIALLPSVPQALVDPAELRALLLGLAALVVLAVGIRLGWQAPFAAGATILLLLIVFNIGPYANAAPRVVLIAAVSAVLLGVGISWEDRVRDGRKIVAYLGAMR